MCPDGVLSVTTPSGITRTTRPPGYAAALGSTGAPTGDSRRAAVLTAHCPTPVVRPGHRQLHSGYSTP